MFGTTDQRVMLGDRAELSRVPCGRCGHVEFIHGDLHERTCLYSECVCQGFAGDVAA
jgi:hypothetical protein